MLEEGRDGDSSKIEGGMGRFLLEEFFPEAGMVVGERWRGIEDWVSS